MADADYSGWIFLAVVIGIYAGFFLLADSIFFSSINFFWKILLKVIPVFVLVIALMAVTNFFIKPKKIAELMDKNSGAKGWIIAIVGGIISTGPIYLWFPLLNDMQKHGVRNSLIATFLYNRAIKIPLIPAIAMYFGLKFTFILLTVMIIFSVAQGWVTEKLEEVI